MALIGRSKIQDVSPVSIKIGSSHVHRPITHLTGDRFDYIHLPTPYSSIRIFVLVRNQGWQSCTAFQCRRYCTDPREICSFRLSTASQMLCYLCTTSSWLFTLQSPHIYFVLRGARCTARKGCRASGLRVSRVGLQRMATSFSSCVLSEAK